ncbi:hypothetical protein V6Z12_D04G162900 [Gossypium hirsutum]
MVGADERSGKERRGMNWEIEMEKMVKTGMHFLEKHVGCIGRIALAVYVMRDRDQEAILEFLGGGSGGAAAVDGGKERVEEKWDSKCLDEKEKEKEKENTRGG